MVVTSRDGLLFQLTQPEYEKLLAAKHMSVDNSLLVLSAMIIAKGVAVTPEKTIGAIMKASPRAIGGYALAMYIYSISRSWAIVAQALVGWSLLTTPGATIIKFGVDAISGVVGGEIEVTTATLGLLILSALPGELFVMSGGLEKIKAMFQSGKGQADWKQVSNVLQSGGSADWRKGFATLSGRDTPIHESWGGLFK